MKLSDQIRQAVNDANAAGVSRYRICKLIGLGEGGFSRFMKGESGLSMENLDALADVLGFRIVGDPARLKRIIARVSRQPKRPAGPALKKGR